MCECLCLCVCMCARPLVASISMCAISLLTVGTCPEHVCICTHPVVHTHSCICTHTHTHTHTQLTQIQCYDIPCVHSILTFLRIPKCIHTYMGTSVNSVRLASEPRSSTLYHVRIYLAWPSTTVTCCLHAVQQYSL